MADFLSREMRSKLMAAIRARGNKSTELRLIAIMRARGIKGWRRGIKLPGSPDFVFAVARVAVFVDGCFWHGCPKHYVRPKSNGSFWEKKVVANRLRDRRVDRRLRSLGWSVVRLWEHDMHGETGSLALKRFLQGMAAWPRHLRPEIWHR